MNILLGSVLGFVVGGFIQSTIGRYLVYDSGTATLLGVVAGLWAAWPFYHWAWLARKTFLHPPVRRYNIPTKQAFAKVRQVLTNSTYKYGDKWFVSFADTMQGKVIACLRFIDEEVRMEGQSVSRMYMRKERKQRLLELEVQMEEEPGDVTAIQFDFRVKVEGMTWHACDQIIYGLLAAVESALGPAVETEAQAKQALLPVPPWWLIGITVLAMMSFSGAVATHLLEIGESLEDAPRDLQRERAERDRSEQSMRDEIAAWKKFKERYIVR